MFAIYSRSRKKMQNVSNLSILAMLIMYMLSALFGYLTFYGISNSLTNRKKRLVFVCFVLPFRSFVLLEFLFFHFFSLSISHGLLFYPSASQTTWRQSCCTLSLKCTSLTPCCCWCVWLSSLPSLLLSPSCFSL